MLELTWNTIPSVEQATAYGTFIVPGGKIVKIESTPNGEEIAELEFPAGKQWIVHLSIFAQESDQ